MNKYVVTIDGQAFEIELKVSTKNANEFTVTIDGRTMQVRLPGGLDTRSTFERIIIDDRPYELTYDSNAGVLNGPLGSHRVELRDKQAAVSRPPSGDSRIKAPIPGMIKQVMVKQGQSVEVGQPLIVLEAMKMENEIRAPRNGIVTGLFADQGKTVIRNEVLMEIE